MIVGEEEAGRRRSFRLITTSREAIREIFVQSSSRRESGRVVFSSRLLHAIT